VERREALRTLVRDGLVLFTPEKDPGFLETPSIAWSADRKGKVRLEKKLVFRDDQQRVWTVPKGFVTDLASVPKAVPGVVRLWMPTALESAWAAILHDWLYATGAVSRGEADRLFRVALRTFGNSKVGAWIMWLGVRAGGWFAWRKHRNTG